MAIVQLSLDEGKTCSRCHTWKNSGDFYKYTRAKDGLQAYCKLCSNILAVGRMSSPEGRAKKNEYMRGYTKEERARAAKKKYQEKLKSRGIVLYRRHREVYRLKSLRYIARKKGSEGGFTLQEWRELCGKYENKCLCCGSKGRLSPDHVIPLSKGGSDFIGNIQPLCRTCNSRKGAKVLDFRT